ncbi:sugar phosphate isomerase/epimerase family protein [Paenibacillus qinlingensis]|uniref:Sugar phosphate isomerase/epimerase n=1 Tax=Paenibacillus qinlingensis TaxID=1837343 RepID=A0ABU1P040_9BACL|nr:sugar phosphate isomerase/epimerase family protein [Paenibacillus qinlingensis]MDR6553075.1 sugar phosphate isomerase/epimerase [Paenibacillus qinlingensis]
MIWNRLGVLTDEVSADFEKAVKWAAEQGLRHVEVRVVNGVNVAELGNAQLIDIRKLVEDHGLYVSAIASPLFKCALDPQRLVESGDTFGQKEQSVEEHFKKLHRVIEIAKLLGTSRIRIFSFWRELDPQKHRNEVIHHLKRAGDIAEREGVMLLLENEPSCNGGFAEEVASLVSGIDSPAVRGLWDPGNEAYGAKEAFPRGYQFMKKSLAHVHLKDAYIRHDGTPKCVPLGSGNVSITAQIKALEADGYTGLYTIETHFVPDSGSQLTGTRMTLDALRALLEEV